MNDTSRELVVRFKRDCVVEATGESSLQARFNRLKPRPNSKHASESQVSYKSLESKQEGRHTADTVFSPLELIVCFL